MAEEGDLSASGPVFSPVDMGRLAAIVDSSDDAIISKTLDGTITTWNRGAADLYGYTAEEMIGESIQRLIPAKSTNELAQILDQIKAGKKLDHFETERVKKDGSPVFVSVTVSPVLDADGNVVAASAIARDITERRRADEERSLMAAIIDSSDDAIISTNMNGIIKSWNHGARMLYGYSADEMINKEMSILISPKNKYELEDILLRVRQGDKISHYETIRVRKDGSEVHVSISVSPVLDALGTTIAASFIARDITQRKLTEEQQKNWISLGFLLVVFCLVVMAFG